MEIMFTKFCLRCQTKKNTHKKKLTEENLVHLIAFPSILTMSIARRGSNNLRVFMDISVGGHESL